MGDIAAVDAAPQHMEALALANRVRLARAELKRRIATQQTTVVDVILDCPWQAESMTISDLLTSQRRWGQARCRRLLLTVGIQENKKLGTLTDRQRRLLADVLSDKQAQATEQDELDAFRGRRELVGSAAAAVG